VKAETDVTQPEIKLGRYGRLLERASLREPVPRSL
jgi:hypothetical protein